MPIRFELYSQNAAAVEAKDAPPWIENATTLSAAALFG
jgi:hypothetical protein